MINPAVSNAYDGTGITYDASLYLIGRKKLEESPPSVRYELLAALYNENGLYDTVARSLHEQNIWMQSLKPLGNPTNEIIEFYAEHLLADLDITKHVETENDAIVEPLTEVWRASNFDAKKILLGRHTPQFGDSFIRVVHPPQSDKIHMELIDPAHVVDFDVDQRGYVTWIRIDIPCARSDERDANGAPREYHHVEVWDSWAQRYRRWEADTRRFSVVESDLSRLGTPVEDLSFSAMDQITFVPIVHVPHRDVGEVRGQACVWPSINKIVELDTIVTAMHQNYFAYDRPTWAIETMGMDGSGRMTPPPPVDSASSGPDASGRDTVYLGRDRLWRLPSGWTLRSTVPDINFEAGLRLIQDYWATLERRHPELLYSRISEMTGGDTSGRAIRFMLSGAVKRVQEARTNLEQGLVRAHQMALTMGQNAGIFSNLGGTFDDGAFDHRFARREVIPSSELEDAQVNLAEGQAMQATQAAGLPLSETLKRANYTDEQIVEIVNAKAAEIDASAVVEQ